MSTAARIANAMQRSIIARSKASAVDLLDIISGREPLENYLRGGRAVLPGAPPRQAQCVLAGSSIEEEHASACWQGDRVVSFRRF
jgi:hypothetical protein